MGKAREKMGKRRWEPTRAALCLRRPRREARRHPPRTVGSRGEGGVQLVLSRGFLHRTWVLRFRRTRMLGHVLLPRRAGVLVRQRVQVQPRFLGHGVESVPLEGLDGLGGQFQSNHAFFLLPKHALPLQVRLLKLLAASVRERDGVSVVGLLPGQIALATHCTRSKRRQPPPLVHFEHACKRTSVPSPRSFTHSAPAAPTRPSHVRRDLVRFPAVARSLRHARTSPGRLLRAPRDA